MLNRKQKVYTFIIAIFAILLCKIHIYLFPIFIEDNVFKILIFRLTYYCSIGLLPFVIARLFPKYSSFDLTWIGKPAVRLRWYLLLPLVIILLSIPIKLISDFYKIPLENHSLNYGNINDLSLTCLLVGALIVSLLCPVAEEIFWRGFIQDQFSKSIGSQTATIAQAFLFAIGHIHYTYLGMIPVFCMGLIFGFWRHKKRSMLPIIIAHIAINSLVAIVTIPVIYEMTRKNIAVDYVEEINELGRSFPDNENADIEYKKAAELYHQPSETLRQFKIIPKNLWPDELTDEQRNYLKSWIEENADALIQFKKATHKPHYWPHYTGNNMQIASIDNELFIYSRLAYAVCWETKFEAIDGELYDAVNGIISAYRFGCHYSNGPKPEPSLLSGIVKKRISCDTGFKLLNRTVLGITELEYFQNQLIQAYQNTDKLLDYTWSKYECLDIIQMLFTDEGDGEGHLPKIEQRFFDKKDPILRTMSNGLSDETIENWKNSDRKETTQLVNDNFDYIDHVMPLTPFQKNCMDPNDFKKLNERAENNVIYPYLPKIRYLHTEYYLNRAKMEALITTIALLRYQKENNDLPDSLAELVDDNYIESIPMDPFSDGSLVYIKQQMISCFTVLGEISRMMVEALIQKRQRKVIRFTGRFSSLSKVNRDL